MPISPRSYSAANHALELDGVKCGFLRSVEGGEVTAEVIEERGAGPFVAKHLGSPKYGEIDMEIGFSVGRPVFDWISATLQGNHQRKKGALLACTHKLEVQSQTDFHEAVVAEIGFPACDAASKEPGYLTLRIAPEYLRTRKGDGRRMAGEFGKGEQKLWLPGNFRLEIPGLDCSRVSRIDPMVVKVARAKESVGDRRDHELAPARLDIPNLRITLAERTVESWAAWHEDFVVNGNNGQEFEKSGSLVFLSPNRKDELARLDLFNLGIFRLAQERGAAADQASRAVAELYCERMEMRMPPRSAALGVEAMPLPG